MIKVRIILQNVRIPKVQNYPLWMSKIIVKIFYGRVRVFGLWVTEKFLENVILTQKM